MKNENTVTIDGGFDNYEEFVDLIEELGDDAYDYL